MAPSRAIPTYALFGEDPSLVEPGYYHVERLAEQLAWQRHDVENHSHPHLCQFTLWLSGGGTYRADEVTVEVRAGLLCWVPAGVVHGFTVEAGSEALVLSISEDFARHQLGEMLGLGSGGLAGQKLVVQLGQDSFEWMALIFGRMEHEYTNGGFTQFSAIGALARLAMAQALQSGRAADDARHVAPGSEASLVARFLSAIEQRLGQRPNVDALASELGTTPYLLNGACRYCLGHRASDAIRLRHIQEAKRLLMFTALSINQIGSRVGFDDPAHFARTFRAVTGQTPKAWRSERIRKETRSISNGFQQISGSAVQQANVCSD